MRNAFVDDVLHHRIRKPPFSSIHTKTRSQRFQKSVLWRAILKKCILVGQTGEKNLRFQTKTDTCGRGPICHNGDRGQNVPWKVNSLIFKFAEVVQWPRPRRGVEIYKRKKCDALFACVLPALFPPFVEMLSLILFSRQLYLGCIVTWVSCPISYLCLIIEK